MNLEEQQLLGQRESEIQQQEQQIVEQRRKIQEQEAEVNKIEIPNRSISFQFANKGNRNMSGRTEQIMSQRRSVKEKATEQIQQAKQEIVSYETNILNPAKQQIQNIKQEEADYNTAQSLYNNAPLNLSGVLTGPVGVYYRQFSTNAGFEAEYQSNLSDAITKYNSGNLEALKPFGGVTYLTQTKQLTSNESSNNVNTIPQYNSNNALTSNYDTQTGTFTPANQGNAGSINKQMGFATGLGIVSAKETESKPVTKEQMNIMLNTKDIFTGLTPREQFKSSGYSSVISDSFKQAGYTPSESSALAQLSVSMQKTPSPQLANEYLKQNAGGIYFGGNIKDTIQGTKEYANRFGVIPTAQYILETGIKNAINTSLAKTGVPEKYSNFQIYYSSPIGLGFGTPIGIAPAFLLNQERNLNMATPVTIANGNAKANANQSIITNKNPSRYLNFLTGTKTPIGGEFSAGELGLGLAYIAPVTGEILGGTYVGSVIERTFRGEQVPTLEKVGAFAMGGAFAFRGAREVGLVSAKETKGLSLSKETKVNRLNGITDISKQVSLDTKAQNLRQSFIENTGLGRVKNFAEEKVFPVVSNVKNEVSNLLDTGIGKIKYAKDVVFGSAPRLNAEERYYQKLGERPYGILGKGESILNKPVKAVEGAITTASDFLSGKATHYKNVLFGSPMNLNPLEREQALAFREQLNGINTFNKEAPLRARRYIGGKINEGIVKVGDLLESSRTSNYGKLGKKETIFPAIKRGVRGSSDFLSGKVTHYKNIIFGSPMNLNPEERALGLRLREELGYPVGKKQINQAGNFVRSIPSKVKGAYDESLLSFQVADIKNRVVNAKSEYLSNFAKDYGNFNERVYSKSREITNPIREPVKNILGDISGLGKTIKNKALGRISQVKEKGEIVKRAIFPETQFQSRYKQIYEPFNVEESLNQRSQFILEKGLSERGLSGKQINELNPINKNFLLGQIKNRLKQGGIENIPEARQLAISNLKESQEGNKLRESTSSLFGNRKFKPVSFTKETRAESLPKPDEGTLVQVGGGKQSSYQILKEPEQVLEKPITKTESIQETIQVTTQKPRVLQGRRSSVFMPRQESGVLEPARSVSVSTSQFESQGVSSINIPRLNQRSNQQSSFKNSFQVQGSAFQSPVSKSFQKEKFKQPERTLLRTEQSLFRPSEKGLILPSMLGRRKKRKKEKGRVSQPLTYEPSLGSSIFNIRLKGNKLPTSGNVNIATRRGTLSIGQLKRVNQGLNPFKKSKKKHYNL